MGNGKWEMGNGKWEFLVFFFMFLKGDRCDHQGSLWMRCFFSSRVKPSIEGCENGLLKVATEAGILVAQERRNVETKENVFYWIELMKILNNAILLSPP